jgi:hypothetical protein
MNKILLNEINRMHNLMGTNNILSESVNPLVRALSKLSMFENDIITALNKRNVTKLSQVTVNDITDLIKNRKLTKEIIDSFLDTVSEEIGDVITTDIFRKSNSAELLNILSQEGIDPFIGGMWLKRFAKKNNVDTLDRKFRSEFATEIAGDFEAALFNISQKLTPGELQMIEKAAKELEEISKDPKQRLILQNELKKLGISLDESLNRLIEATKKSNNPSDKKKLETYTTLKKWIDKNIFTIKGQWEFWKRVLLMSVFVYGVKLNIKFCDEKGFGIFCDVFKYLESGKEVVTGVLNCNQKDKFIKYLETEGYDDVSEDNTGCQNDIYFYTFEGEKYSFKYKDGKFIGL